VIHRVLLVRQPPTLVVEWDSLRNFRYLDDFPVFPLANIWEDIGGIQTRTEAKSASDRNKTLGLVTTFLWQHGNNDTSDQI
jgi:hypothetical protein